MKRFYSEVSVEQYDGAWRVLLDTRPIKTQGGAAQIAPTKALAEALAEEWRGQGEEIDPTAFVHRDLADYAIDHVSAGRAAAITKLLAFAETDTLCYRAEPEDSLFKKQQELWEPLLADLEGEQGVRFTRISGIIHRPQSEETLEKLGASLDQRDSFTLAALQTTASLAASLCIGLAALKPDADAGALWDAANLEELWQADLWGTDQEAETRLIKRGEDFAQAVGFARLIAG